MPEYIQMMLDTALRMLMEEKFSTITPLLKIVKLILVNLSNVKSAVVQRLVQLALLSYSL